MSQLFTGERGMGKSLVRFNKILSRPQPHLILLLSRAEDIEDVSVCCCKCSKEPWLDQCRVGKS